MGRLTEKDLTEALEEVWAKPASYANCQKMATFYTLLDHLQEETPAVVRQVEEPAIGDYGDSDFFSAIQGRDPGTVWPIMGDLMEAVKVLHPRLYLATMEKLKN